MGDAELFVRLCGFGWVIGDPSINDVVPLVYDVTDSLYNIHGINFSSAQHLESIGLIRLEGVGSIVKKGLTKRTDIFYFGRRVELTFPKNTGNQLFAGKILLTRAGQQLALVCGARPVDGFFDHIYNGWAKEGLVPKRETEQSDQETDN